MFGVKNWNIEEMTGYRPLTTLADIVEYNGRYLQKHDTYINQVTKHFSNVIYPLLNN